ncbi:MAG: PD-(D/E)XK nuclease family protein [Muribaculaceae bacterium]|nr:PD-(D/E)XK nuclease family protein [Muribaculaceae bacterium]
MNIKNIPLHLSHKPVIGVDYGEVDNNSGAGDAKFLSIGHSTWDYDDISMKIFRMGDEKWSRQSEELPLWRVLDLALLLVARLTNQKSSLKEEVVDEESEQELNDFLKDNASLYSPRIQEMENLLKTFYDQKKASNTPNVFDFATSELSQDAMLCYIFKWADDSYLEHDKELCAVAKELLSIFSGIPAEEIHQVKVGKQWKNIDVWVEINDDVFLIVEDKTSSSIHDDQLERYKETVKDEYGDKRRCSFAYFKLENEPNSTLKQIEGTGYKVITRKDLISILNHYLIGGEDTLIKQFTNHLTYVEEETQKYLYIPVEDWSYYQWQGFFKRLEEDLAIESWGYVANPNGGFMGMWWHFIDFKEDDVQMYLQFEEKKICIKIYFGGERNNRSEIRNKYFHQLMNEAKRAHLHLDRPERFGTGTYMTIGIIPSEEIFGEDQLDIKILISTLRQYEKLIDSCRNNNSSKLNID